MPAARDQAMDLKQRGDRKASKPLMEKRRRARINHCLSQLKSLVVDGKQTENTRQAKLEKADILEMTVRHLHEITRQNKTASLLSEPETEKFEMGYTECIKEVELFLSTCALSGIDPTTWQRLRNHLLNRIKSIQHLKSEPEDPGTTTTTTTTITSTTEQNGKQSPDHCPMSGVVEAARNLTPSPSPSSSPPSWETPEEVSLVPKRLPNGDYALVIPPQVLQRGSCISCPLSAFRLICNHWTSSPDRNRRVGPMEKGRESCCSSPPSPPLSSAVSEASSMEEYQEEYYPNDMEVFAPNDATQSVWRPW